ncbi:hypothetical protein [Enterococcus avium]|nr:hypothetical protein [Enterococcus avium]MDT2485075.1 hypothetical protein [Enterococcus avium]MDT2511433.1 hypothetical protein [Enterococcus avium]
MDDFYKKYGLKEVINASGRMTILGVSKVSDSVMAAQRLFCRIFLIRS